MRVAAVPSKKSPNGGCGNRIRVRNSVCAGLNPAPLARREGKPWRIPSEALTFLLAWGSSTGTKSKASGVKFVMIRAAYGMTADTKFKVNMEGAQKAGLDTGVYLYTLAHYNGKGQGRGAVSFKSHNPTGSPIRCL